MKKLIKTRRMLSELISDRLKTMEGKPFPDISIRVVQEEIEHIEKWYKLYKIAFISLITVVFISVISDFFLREKEDKGYHIPEKTIQFEFKK